MVGGQNNNQLHTASRVNGVNIITFRRSLISSDAGDKEVPTDTEAYIVWAIGRLDDNKEPAFHDIYPKSNIKVAFNSSEPINNCFAFTSNQEVVLEPWERGQIFDRTIRTFNAYIGPSAGKKGYQTIAGKF